MDGNLRQWSSTGGQSHWFVATERVSIRKPWWVVWQVQRWAYLCAGLSLIFLSRQSTKRTSRSSRRKVRQHPDHTPIVYPKPFLE
jgi:hypothetical protein